MVAAFGTGLVLKRDRRWHVDYPRLNRRILMQSGALKPGMRTSWVVKKGPGVAATLFIELTATADGLTISTDGKQEVVRFYHDTMVRGPGRSGRAPVPSKVLRLFFRCPACERVCKMLYFDGHWGCRVCLGLRYPIRSTPADRTLVARQIEDMRRSLINTRPGSRQWKDILGRIAAHHVILSADVARIRRDLRRRLKNDYRR